MLGTFRDGCDIFITLPLFTLFFSSCAFCVGFRVAGSLWPALCHKCLHWDLCSLYLKTLLKIISFSDGGWHQTVRENAHLIKLFSEANNGKCPTTLTSAVMYFENKNSNYVNGMRGGIANYNRSYWRGPAIRKSMSCSGSLRGTWCGRRQG